MKKQLTTNTNKSAKKSSPVSMPKHVKPTKGQSKESLGGGTKKSKGKSL
jgi:hypothetical protein